MTPEQRETLIDFIKNSSPCWKTQSGAIQAALDQIDDQAVAIEKLRYEVKKINCALRQSAAVNDVRSDMIDALCTAISQSKQEPPVIKPDPETAAIADLHNRLVKLEVRLDACKGGFVHFGPEGRSWVDIEL